jgi:hypothetical protein
MRTSFTLFILLIFFLPACENEGESKEDGPVTITYERRSTGCNNYSYGPWEEFCVTIDYPREDLTLDDFEDNFSGSDINCELDCCVNYQYRNAKAFYGTCADVGMDEY